jgi:ABC-type amino acid transport substrate-binding protein
MNKTINKLMLIIFAAIVLGGWAVDPPKTTAEVASPKPQKALLRVGVTANYPPIIFKLKGKITGLEADFALLLGKALDRDVLFVELPWAELINALMEGKIDIVMSGMTITDARKVRVNFSDPYLRSGLVAMMRTGDASKYDSLKKILDSISTVGVVKGTTGEVFVRNRFRSTTTLVAVKDPREAPDLLNNRRIDLFVYDAPAMVWLVSENEATLKGLWEPMNEEYLGWAVSRDDQVLLTKINAALAEWKKNGTVKQMVKNWLPYWKSFD